MQTKTMLISELTHNTNRLIREVMAGKFVAIIKRYDTETCVVMPIDEYRRLKAIEEKETK